MDASCPSRSRPSPAATGISACACARPRADSRMRCFVAVALPAPVRERLGAARDELRRRAPDADVRWVATEGLHITLKFLGEVAEDRLVEVERALSAVAARHPALSLAARGLGAFPAARIARVIWAGVVDGASLAALAGEVEAALSTLGYPPEARDFRPRVTLGRVRSRRGLGPLAGALAAVTDSPFGGWTAHDVVVYRSHLRPTGAVCSALAQAQQAGADA